MSEVQSPCKFYMLEISLIINEEKVYTERFYYGERGQNNFLLSEATSSPADGAMLSLHQCLIPEDFTLKV